MKSKIHLLLVLLLGLISCRSDVDEGTRHPVQHVHDYNDDHDGHDHGNNLEPASDILPDSRLEESDLYGSADRRLWQRPDFIIRRLGDLEGKIIADIGAGPYGYFTFRIASKTKVKKVIAIDIDPEAINYIDSLRTLMLPLDLQNKVETRLVTTDDPRLDVAEANVILMVNTYSYLSDRVEYLRQLKKNIAAGGKLFIIDFKKRKLPLGPPLEQKVALYEVELELEEAGYTAVISDDQSLDYQYIVEATKGLDQ